jgi:hypothetical protein
MICRDGLAFLLPATKVKPRRNKKGRRSWDGGPWGSCYFNLSRLGGPTQPEEQTGYANRATRSIATLSPQELLQSAGRDLLRFSLQLLPSVKLDLR